MERRGGVVGRVAVNHSPETVPKLSASDLVAEGTCGRIAMLKWRAPILDGLCQYRPIDQNGPEKYVWMAEQCWLCWIQGAPDRSYTSNAWIARTVYDGRSSIGLQVLREFGFQPQGSFWRLRTKVMRWPWEYQPTSPREWICFLVRMSQNSVVY